jgi:DNA-directed RNA polymerase subunit RPC12/RpoP
MKKCVKCGKEIYTEKTENDKTVFSTKNIFGKQKQFAAAGGNFLEVTVKCPNCHTQITYKKEELT